MLDVAEHEYLHGLAIACRVYDRHRRLYAASSVTYVADHDGGGITVDLPAGTSKAIRDDVMSCGAVGPLAVLPDGARRCLGGDSLAEEHLSPEDLHTRLRFTGTEADYLRAFQITRSALQHLDLRRISAVMASLHLQLTPIPLDALCAPAIIARAIKATDARIRLKGAARVH